MEELEFLLDAITDLQDERGNTYEPVTLETLRTLIERAQQKEQENRLDRLYN